jgi:hypothetical protein
MYFSGRTGPTIYLQSVSLRARTLCRCCRACSRLLMIPLCLRLLSLQYDGSGYFAWYRQEPRSMYDNGSGFEK